MKSKIQLFTGVVASFPTFPKVTELEGSARPMVIKSYSMFCYSTLQVIRNVIQALKPHCPVLSLSQMFGTICLCPFSLNFLLWQQDSHQVCLRVKWVCVSRGLVWAHTIHIPEAFLRHRPSWLYCLEYFCPYIFIYILQCNCDPSINHDCPWSWMAKW